MSGGDHEDDERRPRGAATIRSDNDERAATTGSGATRDDAERRSCFHAWSNICCCTFELLARTSSSRSLCTSMYGAHL